MVLDDIMTYQSVKHFLGFRIENNILIGDQDPVETGCVNIGEKLLNNLTQKPDFVGQIDAFTKRQSTYAEMREKSVKCALWLKEQGIQSGDVVAVCSENALDVYIPCLAALYVGAIFNPWDYQMTTASAKYFLSLTAPKFIFANESSARTIMKAFEENGGEMFFKIIVFCDIPEFTTLTEILNLPVSEEEINGFSCANVTNPRQTALLLYSSGTTGLPKAAQISHNYLINHMNLHEIWFLKDHISMWYTPLYWITSSFLLLQAILSYSKRIIYPEFNEEIMCKLVQEHKITWLLLGASMLNRLLKSGVLEKYNLKSLQILTVAGAIVKQEIHESIIKLMPQTEILQCYGMTEVGVITSQKKFNKPGSTGVVSKNVQLKVIDPKSESTLAPGQIGEICMKTVCIMNGYHKNLKATEEVIDDNGWVHSGDLGYFDDDGEVFVIDRIKELIKYRGFHVSPVEIETLLYTHPAVYETAVVSVPHEIDEEHPIAFVSTLPGKTVTEDELVNLVAENLVDYKRLRAGVRFMDILPHTPSGKIDRKHLKQIAREFVQK